MLSDHPSYESLSDEDLEILETIEKYWRATPGLIRKDMDIEKEHLNVCLVRLMRNNLVTQKAYALYQLSPEAIEYLSDFENDIDVDLDRSPLDLYYEIDKLRSRS